MRRSARTRSDNADTASVTSKASVPSLNDVGRITRSRAHHNTSQESDNGAGTVHNDSKADNIKVVRRGARSTQPNLQSSEDHDVNLSDHDVPVIARKEDGPEVSGKLPSTTVRPGASRKLRATRRQQQSESEKPSIDASIPPSRSRKQKANVQVDPGRGEAKDDQSGSLKDLRLTKQEHAYVEPLEAESSDLAKTRDKIRMRTIRRLRRRSVELEGQEHLSVVAKQTVGDESKDKQPRGSRMKLLRGKADAEHSVIFDAAPAIDVDLVQQVTGSAPPANVKRSDRLRTQTPESDISMSSRSTTPSSSPGPVFLQPKDLSEDRADSRDALASSSPIDEAEHDSHPASDAVGSEDELAGPKTPMRRSDLRVTRQQGAARPRVKRGRREVSSEPQSQQSLRSSAQTVGQDSQEPSHTMESMHDTNDQEAESFTLGVEPTTSFGESADQFDDSVFVEDTLFPQVEESHGDTPTSLAVREVADHHHQPELQPPDRDPGETIAISEHNELPATPTSVHEMKLMADEQANTPHSAEHINDEDDMEIDRLEHVVTELAHDDDSTRLIVSPKTPRPDTINWYHVEPNTALRETLDLGQSPNVNQDQFGILGDMQASSPTKAPHAEANAQEILPQEEQEDVDQTVEFTEFISLSNIAQSTPVRPDQDMKSSSMEIDASAQLASAAIIPDVVDAEDYMLQTYTRKTPEQDIADNVLDTTQTAIPHYMQSTVAYDARRKTLPAKVVSTPVARGVRPKTAHGAASWSASRSAQESWPSDVRSQPQTPQRGAMRSPTKSTRTFAPFATSTPLLVKPRSNNRADPSTSTSSNRKIRTPNTVAGYTRRQSAVRTRVDPVGLTPSHNDPRRVLLNDNSFKLSRSPARTPLRSITGATASAPMTPHPAMPLRGVIAIVEIYTSEGASASAPFVALLHRLGARTTKIWGDRITHVIFKDGSPSTLQKVALHNKKSMRSGTGSWIHCVNSRWVSDCDSHSSRANESDDAYLVSTEGYNGSAKRKRKSMEPMPVMNIDGQLLRDRSSSRGRSFDARLQSPGMMSRNGVPQTSIFQSPAQGDSRVSSASPATPLWIAAPHRLVQATAPVKRIRKLGGISSIELWNRRMTGWSKSGEVKTGS